MFTVASIFPLKPVMLLIIVIVLKKKQQSLQGMNQTFYP